jgi:4-hydroxy-tetrahydrodipicolinate synthase
MTPDGATMTAMPAIDIPPRLDAITERARWRAILSDVAVVTVTPFAGPQQAAIDRAGLERNVRWLVDRGVRLLVAGGNTGEFAALSPTELIEVVAAHVAGAAGRARVIAGVGYRLEETVDLGKAAMAAAADGLMVHHPIHPYASEAGLVTYYERLAGALAGIPLVLYVRGPQLTPRSIERLAGLSSIVGVKMAVPDPGRFKELAAAVPELAWVCGLAEGHALSFWSAGAIGFTSGIANFTPQLSLRLLEALKAGRLEAAAQIVDRVQPLEDLRAAADGAHNVAVVKAAMDVLGLAGGGLRPPLSSLTATDQPALQTILDELGLGR